MSSGALTFSALSGSGGLSFTLLLCPLCLTVVLILGCGVLTICRLLWTQGLGLHPCMFTDMLC